VVFSLFTKKSESKRPSESEGGRVNSPRQEPSERSQTLKLAEQSTRPSSRPSIEEMKEAARKTAEKIDRIESEMISASAPTANMPKAPAVAKVPITNAKPLNNQNPKGQESASGALQADSLTRSTSIVLGNSADANAIDVIGSQLPGILEEAAILYSNSQYEPAKLTLEAAIQETLPAGYTSLAWLMLFDFHQLCHDRTSFDNLAMDYASRFEASPPAWKDDITEQPTAASQANMANFIAPAHLDEKIKSSLHTLIKAANNKREVRIDFGTLKALDASSALHLVAFFKFFSAAERPLIVINADRLKEIALSNIEAGRRDEQDSIWQLGLTALRLLGQHQAFDDLSIDFCVTYEVSPPSWEPMPLWIRGDNEKGTASPGASTKDASGNAFIIKGELIGNIGPERQALKEFVQNRRELTIDCRKLKRLDFTAAGELLNEVVNMRNTNKGVLLVEPNYLVYTLMMVMGLHEVAEIRTRKN
jgi:anti-anti-sigma regulatory factor